MIFCGKDTIIMGIVVLFFLQITKAHPHDFLRCALYINVGLPYYDSPTG